VNRAKLSLGGTLHASIQDACDAAASGDTIMAQEYFFQEPQGVTIGPVTAKTLTIKGGLSARRWELQHRNRHHHGAGAGEYRAWLTDGGGAGRDWPCARSFALGVIPVSIPNRSVKGGTAWV
jgi:hypothetical protein